MATKIKNETVFNKFYRMMNESGTAYYMTGEDGVKKQIVNRYDFLKSKLTDAWIEKEIEFMMSQKKRCNVSRGQAQNPSMLHQEEVKEADKCANISKSEVTSMEEQFDEDITPELTGVLEATGAETSSSFVSEKEESTSNELFQDEYSDFFSWMNDLETPDTHSDMVEFSFPILISENEIHISV